MAYSAGTSMAALAKHYGVRRQTISELLDRFGVTARPQRGISPDEVDTAADLYANGWSTLRIGRHLGYDTETIRKHLKRLGVEMRLPGR